MGALILIEMKKLISRKRVRVVLIIMFALIMLGVVVVVKNTKNELPKYKISKAKENIEYFTEEKRLAKENGYEDKIDYYNAQIQTYNDELKAVQLLDDKSADWKLKVNKDIELSNAKKKDAINSGIDTDVENENKNILLKQYYLDNKIEYDYNSAGEFFKSFPRFFSSIGRMLLIILVGILASDLVSSEYSPATIKLILTKPVKRFKILLAKFLSCVIVANALILIFELIGGLLIGAIMGFGDPNAPLVIGTRYKMDDVLLGNRGKAISAIIGSSYLCPAWRVLLKYILVQALLITACIAFCFLISTLIKNSAVSTSISFIFIFVTFYITVKLAFFTEIGEQTIISKVLPFIFTTYFDPMVIVDGSLADGIINPIITYNFSLVVLGIWIIVCYLIAHLNFTRKDIL